MLTSILLSWLGLGLLIFSAVLFPGIIAKTKALTSGRKGPSLLQPLWDILRLLRKGSVYSTSSSFVFQLAPVVQFTAVLVALCLIPFGNSPALLSFEGDIVFWVYLLALGKLSLILNALDTGSSFEGMGANREALFSLLAEPAFFILMGGLVMLTGHSSLSEVLKNAHYNDTASYLVGGLSIYVLIQVAMVENSRLPVDDPKTHLELTMTHEVMVLDNSGFDLGLIQAASALKFALFGGLIANLLLPESFPLIAQIVVFLGIQALFAVAVGLMESFRARLKMNMNPLFILSISSVALLVFMVTLVMTGRI